MGKAKKRELIVIFLNKKIVYNLRKCNHLLSKKKKEKRKIRKKTRKT